MTKFHLTGIFLVSAFFFCSCVNQNAAAQKTFFAFDTYCGITASGENSEHAASELAMTYEKLSEYYELCYTTQAGCLPEDETLYGTDIYLGCYEKAEALADKYGGGVNLTCGELTALWGISTDKPKIPSDEDIAAALKKIIPHGEMYKPDTMLDLGAAAKGYACDIAHKYLSATDIDYSVIFLGSSSLFYGTKPNGENFRAGITNPHSDEYIGVIETEAAFISTSGGYERFFEIDNKKYSHILDLETGRPAETDLVSVTIIVPEDTPDGGIMSDYLSTAVYLGGTEEIGKWLAYDEFELVAADESGRVYTDCSGFILNESSGYFYE